MTGEQFAEVIRSLRDARGWTQVELARKSEVALRTVQYVEAGHMPRLETISKFAEGFGLRLAALLFPSEVPA